MFGKWLIGDVTRSHIAVFTSVGDLDKVRNEYGYEYEYEYEYGYKKFLLLKGVRGV